MTEETDKIDPNAGKVPAPAQAIALSPAREAAQIERQRAIAETTIGNGINPFSNGDAFKLAMNIAEFIAQSEFIPADYQGKPANVMVAMDYASRLPGNISPVMLMQNMDVVKGRPGLRGTFLAALVNKSPVFSRLRYEWRGEDNPGKTPSLDYGCRAYATDMASGDVVYGAWIDWRMVQGEGWDKNTKWTHLREQMFMYRATSFWSRVYASDITLGMYEAEELQDTLVGEYTVVRDRSSNAEKLEGRLADAEAVTATVIADAGEPLPAAEPKAAGNKGTRRATRKAPDAAPDPAPAAEPDPVKCDGTHDGPVCDAHECWQTAAAKADEAEAAAERERDTEARKPAASNLFEVS